jgi:hypothetical protein
MADTTATSDTGRPSLNARVSSVALVVGTVALVGLAAQKSSIAPLRLLPMAVLAFGTWAFCDEMGMRKPLVRAGFLAFMFATFAPASAIVDVHSSSLGRLYLLYAFGVMIAMLLWSVAYLHRQRELKVAGALGALVSVTPIVALIVGHIALGAGAAMGIGALLAATDGEELRDFSAINTVDSVFGLWAVLTAWFLRRGHIRASA